MTQLFAVSPFRLLAHADITEHVRLPQGFLSTPISCHGLYSVC